MKWSIGSLKRSENGANFVTHPFNVGKDAERIALTLHVKKGIWAGYQLFDAQGEIRAEYIGGNTPQPVIIGREKMYSPNTVIGPFPAGLWTIKIEALSSKVGMSGEWGTVELQIFEHPGFTKPLDGEVIWTDSDEGRFYLKNFGWDRIFNFDARWYKGDFHTHTVYSDGKMTREENLESAKQRGLDFFVATDHNIVPTSWPKSDVLVIPGVEITMPFGHYNQLGSKTDPFVGMKDARIFSQEGMGRIQQAARNRGTLNSINHPFLTEWKWQCRSTDLSLIDAIEIWNDPTYAANEEATEKALQAWEILLKHGNRITGIGGSDAHMKPDETYPDSEEPSVIGDPATYVYSPQLTADKLLRQMKEGHVVVSRYNCKIDLKIDGALPGDSLKLIIGKSYQATLNFSFHSVSTIEWIVDGVCIDTTHSNTSEKTVQFSEGSYHYLRVQLRDNEGRLIAFTNPVYFGSKDPELKTWGQVLELLND